MQWRNDGTLVLRIGLLSFVMHTKSVRRFASRHLMHGVMQLRPEM